MAGIPGGNILGGGGLPVLFMWIMELKPYFITASHDTKYVGIQSPNVKCMPFNKNITFFCGVACMKQRT